MRDWKKFPVNKHGSGITDNLENGEDGVTTAFQAVCENLTVSRRSGDLETRDGSEYFQSGGSSLQTPTKIRQIFRLEDYIFAYCYDDPISGTTIDGQLYWILEDGTSTAWEIVETARDGNNRGGAAALARRGYVLSAAKTESARQGEGFVYYWVQTSWYVTLFTATRWVCNHTALGATAPDPAFTVTLDSLGPPPNVGRLVLTINIDKIDNGRLFTLAAGAGTVIDYGDIATAIDVVLTASPAAVAGVTEYLTGTLATTPVTLNGLYGVNAAATWGPAGALLPVFTEQGHLSTQEWQGHIYLSLEPYDKTFLFNPDDPDATDPDSYEPGNDREPLKKLYIKWEDQIDIPKCTNAQMPKSFTSIQRRHGDTNFSFYEFDLAFLAKTDGDTAQPEETSHEQATSGWLDSDTDPMLKLWIERGPTAKSVFGAPSVIPVSRADAVLLTDLIIDVFPSYQNDSGSPQPSIPTVYDEYDFEWSTTGFAAYYYTHSADALLVLIPSDFVEDTETGGLNDRSADGESIRDAIELAFANYNARPNTDQLTKGHHAPLNVATAWRNNLLPSEVVVGQNYNDSAGSGAYLWYRSVATAAGDGGSPLPMGRGIIKTMFVDSKVILDDQYIESAIVTYAYGFYLRESYVALVENTPRTFIFDGPSELISLGTISELRAEGDHDQVTILAGLTSAVDNASGYVIDFNQMIAIIARSENGGIVFFNEANDNFFIPTSMQDHGAPTNTGSPWDSSEDWNNRVSSYAAVISELADEQLNILSEAYFNGGVLTYDALPQAGGYYFTVVNQVGYYANIIGSNQRVYQSTPSIPHSSPATFFDDFDDPVSSLNHFLDKAIVFTPITTWRIEGIRGATGAGRTFIRLVSDEYGSVANQMVVRTNRGLFYWSKVGIIYTDGLSAYRVTDHLIDTYEGWIADNFATDNEIGPAYLRGSFNEKDQRIYWSIFDSDGDPMWVIMDVYGPLSNTMPVQTAKGHVLKYENSSAAIEKLPLFDTNATHYSEKSLRFYRAQNKELLTHKRSFPMDEYNIETADFDLPAGQSITNGVVRMPIKPFMQSIGHDYGLKGITKWTHRVLLSMREGNKFGVAVRPLGWNDFGAEPHELGGCLNYQNTEWSADYNTLPDPAADLKQFFQHYDVAFRNTHHITFRRRFPRGRIRNIYKQVGFRELPVNMGTVTVGSGNVDAAVITMKTTDYIAVQLNTSDLSDNAVQALGVDSSGSWYMFIENLVLGEGSWFQIFSVLETTGLNYVMFLKPDKFSISVEDSSAYVTSFNFGKVPGEQKISLIDYELTYAYIGDRSIGLFKDPADGGDNG